MKTKKMFALFVLILAFSLASAGCGGSGGDKKTASENKAPIKIGFFAPVTGPAAADGDSVTKAAKLAIEKINKTGGINGMIENFVADCMAIRANDSQDHFCFVFHNHPRPFHS